jgi:hypothetical protein
MGHSALKGETNMFDKKVHAWKAISGSGQYTDDADGFSISLMDFRRAKGFVNTGYLCGLDTRPAFNTPPEALRGFVVVRVGRAKGIYPGWYIMEESKLAA